MKPTRAGTWKKWTNQKSASRLRDNASESEVDRIQFNCLSIFDYHFVLFLGTIVNIVNKDSDKGTKKKPSGENIKRSLSFRVHVKTISD